MLTVRAAKIGVTIIKHKSTAEAQTVNLRKYVFILTSRNQCAITRILPQWIKIEILIPI